MPITSGLSFGIITRRKMKLKSTQFILWFLGRWSSLVWWQTSCLSPCWSSGHPPGYSRKQLKVLSNKSMARLLGLHSCTALAGLSEGQAQIHGVLHLQYWLGSRVKRGLMLCKFWELNGKWLLLFSCIWKLNFHRFCKNRPKQHWSLMVLSIDHSLVSKLNWGIEINLHVESCTVRLHREADGGQQPCKWKVMSESHVKTCISWAIFEIRFEGWYFEQ